MRAQRSKRCWRRCVVLSILPSVTAFTIPGPASQRSNHVLRSTWQERRGSMPWDYDGSRVGGRRDGVAMMVMRHVVNGETDIFCNREINMQQIRAIGYDMDYTLAQYNLDFELLAYNGAKEKLVKDLGYPAAVSEFQYNSTYFRRGLVIDKERGNVLKMDRHKYVRQAYHGFKPLPAAMRKQLYMSSSERMPQYTEANYVNIDTLFLLVDACLFAQLVDYKDTHAGEIKHDYATIYKHIRMSVDLCHRDGVIKDRVAESPGSYILPDPMVVTMLKQYRESGRKTFLVTNSLWDYTDVVMNFLTGNERAEDRNLQWLDLFDIVIVGSRKPAFLVDPSALLLRVNPSDGSLRNVDGVEKPVDKFLAEGKPCGLLLRVNPSDGSMRSLDGVEKPVDKFLAEEKVFQGGNWKHLLEMLRLQSGDNVMYVGDHMYSDILRTKRSLGWRTCLVIPELAEEVDSLKDHAELDNKLHEHRSARLDLDEEQDKAYKSLRHATTDEDTQAAKRLMAELSARGDALDDTIKALCREYHSKFHPVWGKIFETGFQESRFAKQVSTYACIYTTKASNLGLVSPERWFRVVRDTLPHDVLIDDCTIRDQGP